MTDLDSLARAATHELLDRTTPDVPGRYAELRRIRARRTAAKLGAVAAAVAITAGGWQLLSEPDGVEPAPPLPGRPTNGTLVSVSYEEGVGTKFRTVQGQPLLHAPDDVAKFVPVRFTVDGRSVVYADRRGRAVMTDVADGSERTLAECPESYCDPVLSSDGRLLAFTGDGGIWVQRVGTEEAEFLRLDGVGTASSPSWSPDGGRIAFTTVDGVYVMEADGSRAHRVFTSTDPSGNVLQVSWAPDGSRLAFFDTRTVHQANYDEDAFTAMTARPDGTDATVLHAAGQCYCLGLTPPYLTWSPDSRYVAVATTKDAGPWGVYLARPDGSSWERVASGQYGPLAWQPVPGVSPSP